MTADAISKRPRATSLPRHPALGLGAAALALGLSLPGCDEGTTDGEDPSVEFRDGALDEVNDPIGVWARGVVDDEMTFGTSYLDMLKQISEQQGCDESTIDSYVITDALVAGSNFPRIVNTVCSTDRRKADQAFFALSFPDASESDVDTRRIEMFAWDGKERRYRFYETEEIGGGRVHLKVEPEACEECHTGPRGFDDHGMPMTPIMNELSAPWEHWFAQPISVSHDVPEAVQTAPHFAELAGRDSPFLKSAARLEQTIRTSYSQRVASTRVRARRNKPADAMAAMSMLRPLFCDEQVSYLSEDGSSGLLASSAVVDDGLHSVFFSLQGVGWPWEWWNDRIMRLPTAGGGRSNPDSISLIPVRGASVVAYERQLMASRGLSAMQVMQVRALDFHTPVFSDLRCRLWSSANERVAENPPEAEEGARTLALFDPLLQEILTLHPADFPELEGRELPEAIPITSGDERSVVVMGRANEDLLELAERMAQGTIDAAECTQDGRDVCLAEPREFGDMIEVRFKTLEGGGRGELQRLRDRRSCLVAANYPNTPFIDGAPDEDECEGLLADQGPG